MLVIMRGPSCSGKSSFIKGAKPSSIISSDNIREELSGDRSNQSINTLVFQEMEHRLHIRLSLKVGLTIIDSTNLKMKQIRKWMDIADQYNESILVVSVVPDSVEALYANRDKRVSEGDLYVPDDVILRHYKTFNSATTGVYNELKKINNDRDDDRFVYHEMYNPSTSFIDVKHWSDSHYFSNEINSINSETLYYAIGDIHGCYEELDELLEKIKLHADGTSYKVISVGDVIDRGPNSFRCFKSLLKADAIILMGNHEYKFITEHFYGEYCNSKPRRTTHVEVVNLNVTNATLFFYCLYTLKPYQKILLRDKTVILSHAPFDLNKNLNDCYLTATDWCMNNEPYPTGSEFEEKYKHTQFVHGHQHWDYNNEHASNVFNIDSGCVYGKQLTAMCINNNELITVDAKQKYV